MKSEKGAIMMIMSLVAVLVISVGRYVYNSSMSTISPATDSMKQFENAYSNSTITNSIKSNSTNINASIDQQSKDVYNASVELYLGNSVSGTQVKVLISTIINSNNQNIGEDDRFISIEMDGENTLNEACEEANPYDYGENTSENVKTASNQMNILKTKINTSKTYTVKATYDSGLIVKVEISEN